MKKATAASLLLFVATSTVQAGVVMEMVTSDASGQETERSKIYAQSKLIRMDEVDPTGAGASMIFLGDRFLYVDHKDKSYMVIDEAMLEDVSSQISEAMKEMEAQLAAMPPEQRAMMEQMMEGRMQGMMGQQGPKPPPPRIEAKGNSKWQSYDCRRYEVFEGDEMTQEVCSTDLDDIEGSGEFIAAFRNMAEYMTKMTESMPMRGDNGVNPGELMKQIDGFPVHTIEYENGQVASESSVESVTEQSLDSTLFAAPEGYQRKDPMRGR